MFGGGADQGLFFWLGQGLTDTLTTSGSRTYVGTLATNEYWDGVNTLTGDIIVPAGKILRLAEGAEIRVPAGNKLVLNGSILNEATEGNPLLFTSTAVSPAAGDWDGIHIGSPQLMEDMVLRYSTNGFVLTNGATTFSRVKVSDSSVSAISGLAYSDVLVSNSTFNAIGANAIELGANSTVQSSVLSQIGATALRIGTGSLVEDNVIHEAADGVQIDGATELRRNLISVTTARAVNVNTTAAVDLHHNLLLDGVKGISVVNNGHTTAEYNTLNNFSSRGLEFNYSASGALGNVANYNIVTNVNDGALGGVAYYGSAYLLNQGNASFNVDNAFGGLAIGAATVPEHLTTDPGYILTGSLTPSVVPTGDLMAQIGNGIDYRVGAASAHLHHSEYGAQIGAYNLVTEITSVNPLESVSRTHQLSYLNNSSTLAGMVIFSRPIDTFGFDLLNVDSSYLDGDVALTDMTTDGGRPVYWYSYVMDAANSVVDGSGKRFGLVATDVDGYGETIDFLPLTVDNSGPAVAVSGITESEIITVETEVSISTTDSLIGAHQLEYSHDGGTTWEAGDGHIVLQSAGSLDGYAAAVLIDGVNAVGSLDGINVVELNGGDFTAIGGSFQSFTNAQIPALITYLEELPDDTIIALAVKGNGRSANATENNTLNSALDAFGFDTSWAADDSFVAMGYKGARKLFSHSETMAAGSGNPLVVDLSQLANGAMMNTTVTLPADTLGAQSLQIRGIDFLGNVGATTTINYTVQ